VERLWNDIRYAIRMLLKQPGFTAVAVLTLALGIGANTAIFSFVNGILFRPLPFSEPDRLVALWETHPEKGGSTASTHNVEDWARSSRTMEQFGVWRDWGLTLKGPEGPEPLSAGIASPEFFQVLRAQPELGRLFSGEENQPGKDHVVLLSDALWRTRFGGDREILGRSLNLSGEVFTVVGILPAEFEAPSFSGTDVWAPHSIDADLKQGRWLRNRRVIARLKPGATLEQARVEMATVAQQLARAYPDSQGGWSIALTSLQDREVGSFRSAFLVFMGAVGFVLLIACANVANLLLARAAARKKEFAIRAALGASRRRVVRQMLTESVLLAILGGALGCLLAFWAVDLFVALSPRGIPRLEQVHVDRSALGFNLLLSMLAGILFGIAPAAHAAKKDLVESLKEGTRAAGTAPGMSLRNVLVSAETALALVLLIGAGLLLQSFVRMVTFQPGYNPEKLLTFEVYPGMKRYPQAKQVTALYEQIAENLQAIPGVRAVANVSSGPLFGGDESVEFQVEGHALSEAGKNPVANYHNASSGYFRAMEVPLLKGRDFDAHDDASAPPVAIINDMMARRWWPEQNPVGQRLWLVRSKASVEIIGVVGDVHRPALNSPVEPEIYWPYRQQTRWASYFVLRASVAPESLIPVVRSRIAQLDREVLVSNMRTMDQRLARAVQWPRFLATLLGIFAGVALLLAVVGVYGVISYAVSQRTHEIGIRMALGAQPRDVLQLVLRRGLLLSLTGVAIGLAAALALARYLEGLLFEGHARDPYVFGGVAALLAAVALVACYVPARRATKVDPMVALRYE
jgi:putative ABC transport system permease protein